MLQDEPAVSVEDTPISRSTVCMLTTVDLEKELDIIRERRLALRLKIEALAKVKTDKADLTSYLSYEKLLPLVKKALAKLDVDHESLQKNINKLRAYVMDME